MSNMPKAALGTWSWGVGKNGGDRIFGNELSAEDVRPVFEEAMENGLNLWDTAMAYGLGASEEILGRLLKNVSREDVILSTKFTPGFHDREADNPALAMCEDSLKRLGTDYIDIFWMHTSDNVETWTPMLAPLVKQGLVKRIGVSNHNLAQTKRAEEILSAEGVHVSAVQNHFSLLYRATEQGGVIDYCKEHDMDFFGYMVLEQGALSGKYGKDNPMPERSRRGKAYNEYWGDIEKLIAVEKEIADAHGTDVVQIPMAWAMNKGITPLLGVTHTGQVKDIVAAMKIALSEEEIAALEAAADATGFDAKGVWEPAMV